MICSRGTLPNYVHNYYFVKKDFKITNRRNNSNVSEIFRFYYKNHLYNKTSFKYLGYI